MVEETERKPNMCDSTCQNDGRSGQYKCTLPDGHNGLHLASPSKFVWGEWREFTDRETLENGQREESTHYTSPAKALTGEDLGHFISWESWGLHGDKNVRGGRLLGFGGISEYDYGQPVALIIDGAETVSVSREQTITIWKGNR